MSEVKKERSVVEVMADFERLYPLDARIVREHASSLGDGIVAMHQKLTAERTAKEAALAKLAEAERTLESEHVRKRTLHANYDVERTRAESAEAELRKVREGLQRLYDHGYTTAADHDFVRTLLRGCGEAE